MNPGEEFTKLLFHLKNDDTPYMKKIYKNVNNITLFDVKTILELDDGNRFYFKSKDSDEGVVKEQICNNKDIVPNFDGRIICYVLLTKHNSIGASHDSINGVNCNHSCQSSCVNSCYDDITTESNFSKNINIPSSGQLGSCEISQLDKYNKNQNKKFKHKYPEDNFSMTSMTDTNNSLKVIKVTLDMDFYKFLGISIVGQSDEHSDGGIYVGSIRKDGAVYKNGRIDPGDMILEVNNIYFGNINNNKAVNYLREAVEKGGKLTLMVAKCWNDGAVDFSQSEQMDDEIETSAWTQQSRILKNKRHSISLKSSTASLTSSLPETDFCGLNLTSNTDMTTIIKAMCQPNSGLIIRNRSWLKLSIPNSVIGSDVVDWLYTNVDGFVVRKDAKKYAASLLKYGYIIHSVDKPTFSEQCYYTFNTSVSDLSIMTNENFENSICSPWNISYKNPQIFNAHNKDKPEINIKSKYLVGKETTCSCIMKPNYKKIYNKIIPKALMSESKDKKNIDKRVDSSSSDDFYSTYSYCDSFENKEKNFKKNDESINLTKKHTKDKCVNPNKYYYNQHQTSVANYTYQSNLPKLVSSDSNFNDSCNENVNIKSNLQGFDSALENLTQPSKYISLENAKFTNVL